MNLAPEDAVAWKNDASVLRALSSIRRSRRAP
jgi:hypothetical protein